MTKTTGVGRGNNPASHVNRPKGQCHHRWQDGKIISSHGYVKVRVGPEHPLADPNGYAYEHLMVWISAGRERPGIGQTLHHENADKTDNRLGNLALISRSEHAALHHNMIPSERVRELRERYAAGENGTSLAEAFGIPYQRVYKMLHGGIRRDAGGPIQTGSLRGKKLAGRRLDGLTHDQFPESV